MHNPNTYFIGIFHGLLKPISPQVPQIYKIFWCDYYFTGVIIASKEELNSKGL